MFKVEIREKIAWVTGASRGIGRASALALADAGADVVVSYRSKEKEAEEVVEQIRKKGRKSISVKLDIGIREDCEKAFEKITKEFGMIDILVNNAAVIADNLFLMLEPEDWQKVLNTNVLGNVYLTRLVLRDMMYKRWGRIINMSSVAATKGGRGQSNYAASKAAIEAMTRSLAVEVARQGVRINCIAPGVVETDMSSEVIKLAKDEILSRQLIKRFASPEEIAPWVVLLASDYADFMTGEVIHIDGGMKMP